MRARIPWSTRRATTGRLACMKSRSRSRRSGSWCRGRPPDTEGDRREEVVANRDHLLDPEYRRHAARRGVLVDGLQDGARVALRIDRRQRPAASAPDRRARHAAHRRTQLRRLRRQQRRHHRRAVARRRHGRPGRGAVGAVPATQARRAGGRAARPAAHLERRRVHRAVRRLRRAALDDAEPRSEGPRHRRALGHPGVRDLRGRDLRLPRLHVAQGAAAGDRPGRGEDLGAPVASRARPAGPGEHAPADAGAHERAARPWRRSAEAHRAHAARARPPARSQPDHGPLLPDAPRLARLCVARFAGGDPARRELPARQDGRRSDWPPPGAG